VPSRPGETVDATPGVVGGGVELAVDELAPEPTENALTMPATSVAAAATESPEMTGWDGWGTTAHARPGV